MSSGDSSAGKKDEALDEGERLVLEHDLHVIENELSEREKKLSEVEREMAAIEYELGSFRSDRFVRAGVASRIIAAEQYRAQLNLDLTRKRKHQSMLLEEVSKANEKREKVLRDLATFSGEGV